MAHVLEEEIKKAEDLTMDILDVRTEHGIQKLKKSQQARFASEDTVDLVETFDVQWRKLLVKQDNRRAEVNKIQREIGKLFQSGKKGEAEKLVKEKENIELQIDREEVLVAKMLQLRDEYFDQIGNIVHSTVPISNTEEDNAEIKTWGVCKPITNAPLHHSDVLHRIDGYSSASAIAGSRSFFLKGPGVLLNQALINYAISFLTSKKFGQSGVESTYQLLQTPFFMNQDVMAKTAQLSDFDEQLYKVTVGKDDDPKYLIATSEQPISGYHVGEWLEESALPKRYLGYSTCFRKEAGSSGKDLRGIFRLHQFEKVEQFCLTRPEDSWSMLEEMLRNSEEFYESLELPYHVITIVSGALNQAASKKYDLEAWFP